MSDVGRAAPPSLTATRALPLRASGLETLHLEPVERPVVGRGDEKRCQDGRLPGRGRNRYKSGVRNLRSVNVEPEVAVVSAHQQDFIARGDRARLGTGGHNRRLPGDRNLTIRGGRQKRESIARLRLNQRLEVVPRRGLRAIAAGGLGLSVHRIKVPDMSEGRRRRGAATIDRGRTDGNSEGEQQNHSVAECLHRKAPVT